MEKQNYQIVVIDDDAIVLQAAKMILKDSEFEGHFFPSSAQADKFLAANAADVVVLDLNLKGENGIDVLHRFKRKYPFLEFVFCSGETDVSRAIACIREGASDYLVKPFNGEDLRLLLKRATDKQDLKKKVEVLGPLVSPLPVQFIGGSRALDDLRDKIKKVQGQPHLNILIMGESGTGKEVVAQLLHQQEAASAPFVAINVAALPPSLMEAELFGYEKGAFTDAKQTRAGKFELAEKGDIFLDEIGDLPIEMQAKILRVLQEKEVSRLGSIKPTKTSFRVISATNRSLADLVVEGRFREDLVYRLSDIVIWLPPLRDRKEDIPELVEHFLKKYSQSTNLPTLSEKAMRTLNNYHWPGNVRQLESTLKRAVVFNSGKTIDSIEIYDPSVLTPIMNHLRVPSNSLPSQKSEFEKRMITDALSRHNGDRKATMTELKLSKATFYRRIQQLGIVLESTP